ncbi:WD40 repeat domain-containing protein [Couchioplanes azureus]|uniref:hypothetical protein n=1 Tax=Couchioplanes caeruleus TaxID=56438 RepID=UPI00167081C1|nr:hypothetical protein [Couchioplanes caeruleus]GGQ82228.1 hypothetical protein GCM10010166_60390 [Couchioplanes caeruleus subsp. azureus]
MRETPMPDATSWRAVAEEPVGAADQPAIARAVDVALREAGGGRVAGVRTTHAYGRAGYLVQFIRDTWLCTASVDAATAEVTAIVDDGAPGTARRPGAPRTSGVRTTFGSCAAHSVQTAFDSCAVQGVEAAVDDATLAYVATDSGIGVVHLRHDLRWHLVVEDHHSTGLGAVRQVTPVAGGVIGTTTDGVLFRLDRHGRQGWITHLPARVHTVAADPAGDRLVVATDAGAVEADARTGAVLDASADRTPVLAAAYLPGGRRITAGPRGTLTVTGPDGRRLWQWRQGETPARLWAHGDRVFLAGRGGLKEIVVGEGVVCRWSAPAAAPVADAVVANGHVFTCTPGLSVDHHDYATAGYLGVLPGMRAEPAVITTLHPAGDQPWILVGHRDGTLSAHRTEPVHR